MEEKQEMRRKVIVKFTKHSKAVSKAIDVLVNNKFIVTEYVQVLMPLNTRKRSKK